MGEIILDIFNILRDLFFSYPSSFIDKTFRKFFSGYISSRSFLPFRDNESQFSQMRIALSGQASRQQSQVELRIATLTNDNDQLVEDSDKKEEIIIQENNKPNKLQNKLIIHYTHEKRFNTRKRDLHRIFQETFVNTSIMETKLIVGNTNRKNTMKELIQKRPTNAILKNEAKASKRNFENKVAFKNHTSYNELLILDENREKNSHRRPKPQNQTTNQQI
ncbi:unnamed protein product [Rotaria magnacalcarata]|nr:unnamed protein product [Rotaria magnacalcarata]